MLPKEQLSYIIWLYVSFNWLMEHGVKQFI